MIVGVSALVSGTRVVGALDRARPIVSGGEGPDAVRGKISKRPWTLMRPRRLSSGSRQFHRRCALPPRMAGVPPRVSLDGRKPRIWWGSRVATRGPLGFPAFEGRACRMLLGIDRFDRVVLIYNPVNRRVPLTMAESMRDELGHDCPICRSCCGRPSTRVRPVSWPAALRRQERR